MEIYTANVAYTTTILQNKARWINVVPGHGPEAFTVDNLLFEEYLNGSIGQQELLETYKDQLKASFFRDSTVWKNLFKDYPSEGNSKPLIVFCDQKNVRLPLRRMFVESAVIFFRSQLKKELVYLGEYPV